MNPTTTPKFSPYGGFSEGDHVTRMGCDVHLASNMNEDGFTADFLCVVAPPTGWIAVGETEHNTCARYERVTMNSETGQWEITPGPRKRQPTPEQLHAAFRQAVLEAWAPVVKKLFREFVKARILPKLYRAQRKKLHRHPKRRALRK